MSFLSYLKDGISLGSIYAIIALGYTMVYGIAKMLNFAHGDVIMVGGILLGVIEIFGKAYISSQVADAICFAVLIVVLLVKPTGLFGKNIQEKV